MHDSSVEEFSTPRPTLVHRRHVIPDGDGDGVRNVQVRRPGAPSSRKFCARGARDEKSKGRLERALKEMGEVGEEKDAEGEKKLRVCCAAVKRARTVAEITPTKMRVKRRPAIKPPTPGADHSVATLHATPRPFDDAPSASTRASPRPCRRPDALCRTYERLMLKAWRRQRGRLGEAVEKGERFQNQVSQLEVQVDFLKAMRNSECEKRDEALSECQLLRRKIDVFEAENSHLIKELKVTQEELTNTKKNFKLAKCDLKKSSEQVSKLQDQLRKKKEEKLDLLSKVSSHEQEITSQMSIITGLKEELKITKMNLQNTEVNLNNKQDALEEMIQHLRAEVDINSSLKEEAAALRASETDLANRSKYLEEQLEDYVSRCEELAEENASTRQELLDASLVLEDERKKWYRGTRELARCSLVALRQIATAYLTPGYRIY
ncbi:unnamed protein product [Phaedon cochleariae]|uniref:Uncharacterized protein n=1 Tax=Phaedon cochleariae TaxID=80249 RepID=A0A9P0DPD1_PHACE|nr:unnamed protein product [Phaedon cochleariae]